MVGNTVFHHRIFQNIRGHSANGAGSPQCPIYRHIPDHRMLCPARKKSSIFLHCDHMSRLYFKIRDLRILHHSEQSSKVPGRLVHAKIRDSLPISVKMTFKRTHFSRPHIRTGSVKTDRDPVHAAEIDIFPQFKPGTSIITRVRSLPSSNFHSHGRENRKSDQMLFCRELVRFFFASVSGSSTQEAHITYIRTPDLIVRREYSDLPGRIRRSRDFPLRRLHAS